MDHVFFRPIDFDDIYHKRVPPPFLPFLKSVTDTSNFDKEFTGQATTLSPTDPGNAHMSYSLTSSAFGGYAK
jgi:hypothetical protein